jgi:hypothetical protein
MECVNISIYASNKFKYNLKALLDYRTPNSIAFAHKSLPSVDSDISEVIPPYHQGSLNVLTISRRDKTVAQRSHKLDSGSSVSLYFSAKASCVILRSWIYSSTRCFNCSSS